MHNRYEKYPISSQVPRNFEQQPDRMSNRGRPLFYEIKSSEKILGTLQYIFMIIVTYRFQYCIDHFYTIVSFVILVIYLFTYFYVFCNTALIRYIFLLLLSREFVQFVSLPAEISASS